MEQRRDLSDFSEFQQELARAARASFEDLRAARPVEHFYAYALYTDSSAMTVMPAANSLEALAEVRKEMDIEDGDRAPEYKWGTGEWRYEAWKAGYFAGISAKLRAQMDSEDVALRAKAVHGDMTAALHLLDQEGFFGVGDARNKVVLFVSISDDDGAIRLENDSALILNPPIVCQEFMKRYEA